MRIRQASPQDAQGLAEVHALSWQAAYAGLIDPEFLKTRTLQRSLETFKRNGCAEIWLAEQADKIVGFCRIGTEEDDGEPVSYTHLDVYKRQVHQGIKIVDAVGILHAGGEVV